MTYTAGTALCGKGSTNDGTPIIMHLDQIVLFYAPCFRIVRVEVNYPIVPIANLYPMILNIV